MIVIRAAFVLLVLAVAGSPAIGQPPACEQSVSDDLGEVIASVDGRGATTISWAVERRNGVGQESEYFARPGLLIDFGMRADALGSPQRVEVLISRYTESERQAPPPLSSISVRARSGGQTVLWAGNKSKDGQAELLGQLKNTWPNELVVDLLDRAGNVLASASFDLSKRARVEGLAHEARAKCPA